MTAEPALPWADGQGGAVTFNPGITAEEILAGKVRITTTTGQLLTVRGGATDVYDFIDRDGTAVCTLIMSGTTSGQVNVRSSWRIMSITAAA